MRVQRRGLSLVELSICAVVLGILATALQPFSGVAARRRSELELRRALREMRVAIDRFVEDRSVQRQRRTWPELYPRDLEELVEARYLRRIPRDPFTGRAAWRLIGTADPPEESDLSWSRSGDAAVLESASSALELESDEDSDAPVGPNGALFDVRSLSRETALDGTSYGDW